MKILPAYAATLEGIDLAGRIQPCLELGVGKVAAAISMTRALLESPRPDAVLLFGVCGAFPSHHVAAGTALAVSDLCLVGEEFLADEGVEEPHGFRDLAQLDLGSPGPIPADADLTSRAAALLGGLPVVRGATVSTCSGTDVRSAALASRTGASVETMEGAAVASACARFDLPFLQLRCVSNLTGDRDDAAWRLQEAAAKVQQAAERLLNSLETTP